MRNYKIKIVSKDKTYDNLQIPANSFFDAANKACINNLPGYQVIPGGKSYPISISNDGILIETKSFEAINHSLGLGALIWVML